ncbi:DUF423 domain-containing protein [Neptunitalea lumnitzerae]|uniref:Membrane protein n=1 Tax=Neptunitalea lumnitzerae TaxID=2965509 RepID=A0ABQ5MGE9_9FLAO|nr:DUF423 domain-containing protein [Neptunitalea sp. Y10]GLB48501.1 membrane protein [Neptunitalea sp. Y10]
MKTGKILATAAFLGLIAVVLGAFGAHGLKKLVTPEQVESFKTGVTYQMYHALALLAVGLAKIPASKQKKIFIFMLTGVLLFSGSIYLLTFKNFIPFNISFIGPITPLGGVAMIVGWGLFALSFKDYR